MSEELSAVGQSLKSAVLLERKLKIGISVNPLISNNLEHFKAGA
jgi:hypothetical protein